MGDTNVLSDDELEDLAQLQSDDEHWLENEERMASEEEHEVAGGFEKIDEDNDDDNELNFTHTFTEASDIFTELDENEEMEGIGSELESLVIEPTLKAATEPTKHNVEDEMALVHVSTLLALVKKAYGLKCKGCSELLEYKTKNAKLNHQFVDSFRYDVIYDLTSVMN